MDYSIVSKINTRTDIQAQVAGWLVQHSFDVCVQMSREQPPSFPGTLLCSVQYAQGIIATGGQSLVAPYLAAISMNEEIAYNVALETLTPVPDATIDSAMQYAWPRISAGR